MRPRDTSRRSAPAVAPAGPHAPVSWRRAAVRLSGDAHPSALLRGLVLAGVALFVLTACSTVRVLYYGADILVRQYADDYVGLDNTVLAAWQPHLTEALSRHKADELPYLARFFDNALRGAQRGFDRETVVCLEDQALLVYRRHARLAADLAAPLLAASRPKQIQTLESRLRDDWAQEATSDAQAIARRERKRAKRYADAARWWVGGLTPAQEAIVQSATQGMPDTAPAWEAYRRSRQQGLLHLLRQGAGEAEIRTYLYAWLVEQRDLPDSLAQSIQQMRLALADLVVRLDASFSPAQREQFLRRLRGLRDDFLALQNRPYLADLSCG
jgi:hypothetical protein